MNNLDTLHARAKALGLHGLLAHWHDATATEWPHHLIEWEEQERARRSLERRLKDAHIGRFNPCATSIGRGQSYATSPPSKP